MRVVDCLNIYYSSKLSIQTEIFKVATVHTEFTFSNDGACEEVLTTVRTKRDEYSTVEKTDGDSEETYAWPRL